MTPGTLVRNASEQQAGTRLLLACGVLSSLVYVGADALAAAGREGYSPVSQTISELGAIGTSSRPLMVGAGLAYCALVIAFGIGVWRASGEHRALRVIGALLVAYGVTGLAGPFFPMHPRGAGTTFTDAMHVALTGVVVLFILLQLAVGAAAYGGRFRAYSLATLAVVAVAGTLAGLDGPRIAAGEPTPWVGVTERLCVGAYLAWVAVLAVLLLRSPVSGSPVRGARLGDGGKRPATT